MSRMATRHSGLVPHVGRQEPLVAEALLDLAAQLETGSTPGLVGLRRTNEDDGVVGMGGAAIDASIGMRRGGAATHADRMEFQDLVGHRHEVRHWAKGTAAEILIEPGKHNIDAFVGK